MKKTLILLFLSLLYPFMAEAVKDQAIHTMRAIPEEYTCDPTIPDAPIETFRDITSHCNLSIVTNKSVKNELSGMAAAIVTYDYDDHQKVFSYNFSNSAVPIYYNESTHTGFLLTYAKQFMVGRKEAHYPITSANIITPGSKDGGSSRIFQPRDYKVIDDLTSSAISQVGMEITAIYVPKSYCINNAFNEEGYCGKTERYNGDIAIVKVRVNPNLDTKRYPYANNELKVSPFKLAGPDLGLWYNEPILGLFYTRDTQEEHENEENESHTLKYPLRYVTYNHFATDEYNGLAASKTLMNGYFVPGSKISPDLYYNIRSHGGTDAAGGGDFYWDGSSWNLIGIHSWNSEERHSSDYDAAANVSVDIRPFKNIIAGLIEKDKAPLGCYSKAEDLGLACNSNYVDPGFPPLEYRRCLPNVGDFSAQVAYGCKVADVTDTSVMDTLLNMGAKFTKYNLESYTSSLSSCTAVPIANGKDSSIMFYLTAAHCLTTGNKVGGTLLTSENIAANLLNVLYAGVKGDIFAGAPVAAYIPDSYCKGGELVSGKCRPVSYIYPDLAVLKVRVGDIKQRIVAKLAGPDLVLPEPGLILGVGYGRTDVSSDDKDLNYVLYNYFATNSYENYNQPYALMNGYFIPGETDPDRGMYYGIRRYGDSGGGDFYWDGSSWILVGISSNGAANISNIYRMANDVSADIRPFATKIEGLINADLEERGCSAKAGSLGFVCKKLTK